MHSNRWIHSGFLFAFLVATSATAGSPEPAYFWLPAAPASERAAAVSALAGLGVVAIADYADGAQLLKLPAERRGEARSAVPNLVDLPRLDLIGHWKGEFDPIREFGSRTAEAAEPSLHWLQFVGPAQDGWLDAVDKVGVERVIPFPYATWLVRADGPEVEQLRGLGLVRWVGPLPADRKFDPEADSWRGRPEGRVTIRVIVFNPQQSTSATEFERDRIVGLGGTIRENGFVGNHEVIRAEIDAIHLDALSRLPNVIAVEAYHPPRIEDESASLITGGHYTGSVGNSPPNPTYANWLTTINLNGSRVTVGIVDDGVDTTETHLSGRVTNILSGAAAGSDGHGHHCAGIVAASCNHAVDTHGYRLGAGAAPGASILNQPFLRTGWAANCGASYTDYGCVIRQTVITNGTNGSPGYLQSNSWGNGTANPMTYTSMEQEYDARVRDADGVVAGNEPLIILFSAGNQGSGGLTRPKAAKNIITTAAVSNYRPSFSEPAYGPPTNINFMASFSSYGNTQDARIKPDVSSPGVSIASSGSPSGTVCGSNFDGNGHRWCTGTSQANPNTAGQAALLVDKWRRDNAGASPSPALVKAMLINYAVDIRTATVGSGDYYNLNPASFAYPNNRMGWGRVDNERHLNPGAIPVKYRDQLAIDTFGSAPLTRTFSYNVGSSAEPVYITLVWTDAPAAINANPQLVNDLDLEVDWNGNTYLGNVLSGKASVTGGARDSRNNVENVFLPVVTAGQTLTVRVKSTAIVGDGIPGNADTTDQDFALVVWNGNDCPLPTAPAGVGAATNGNNRIDVSWNRVVGVAEYRVYRATVSGGPYSQVGTVAEIGSATYTFADTTVSGGTTYYYVVRSFLNCESNNSTQVSATATGACTLAPTFAGLTSVTNPGTATCSLALTWAAATANCGGPITYEVFRSTTSGFVPGAGNRIASGVSGTTYADSDSLVSGTTYYYVVRAIDGGNSVSDANSVQRSGAPTGPGGGTTNYASTDVPKSIPDNNPTGASSVLTVTGTGPITNILCNLNITHTYKADLEVTLTSPLGTVVTLHNNTGGSADDIITTYDTLTAPDGPGTMNDFDGQNPAGVWTLKAVDSAGVDTGTINSWSIDITRTNPCTTGSSCTPPGAPSITAIIDVSSCAQSGVQVTYTGGSGATSHDLWRDGALVVTGYVSGATYNPGNTAAHSYVVQAVKSPGCTTNSPAQNGTDANGSPGAPAITGITDIAACAQTGVQIAYTAGSGATSHNLYRDGSLVVTGYASGATYNPGDSALHSYVVRAIVGACSTDSAAQDGTDGATCAPNLVYTTGSYAFAEVSGDGDTATLLPGEKWSLTFTVTNQGTGAAAADANLTLTGNNGLSSGDFCTNPVTVGALAASATSGPLSASFVLPAAWAGICLSDIQVGFTNKLHNGGQSAGADQTAGSASVAEVAQSVGIPGGGSPVGMTLTPPTDDAWIRNGSDSGGNHGGDTILRVGRHSQNGPNGNTDSLLTFDLSAVPAGSTINAAVLETVVLAVTGISNDSFEIRAVTGASWTEGTVTWASAPAYSGAAAGTIAVDATTGTKTSTSLVALVQGWVNTPASNFGVRILDPTPNNSQYLDFGSTEHGTAANRPRLVINFTPPGAPDCSVWGPETCTIGIGEVSGTASHPFTLTKGTGATVNLSFEDIGGAGTVYNVYVSNAPNTLSFQVSGLAGKRDCAIGTSLGAGGFRSVANYDTSGPTDTGLLCFLVSANTQSQADEGTVGATSGGQTRVCSAWCAR